jgi:hypothetical protein
MLYVRPDTVQVKPGYEHQTLYNVAGGTTAWIEADLEVETLNAACAAPDRFVRTYNPFCYNGVKQQDESRCAFFAAFF